MLGRLLSLQLREQFALSVFRYNWKRNRKAAWRSIGMGALAAYGFLVILAMVLLYCYFMFSAAAAPGMAAGMLAALMAAAQLTSLFTLMRTLPGYLASAKDLQFLRAMPIPHRTLFAAKLLQAMLFPVALSVLLLGSGAVMYAVFQGGGLAFLLKALVVIPLAPCVPAAVAGALSLLVLRFSAGARRSESWTTVLWVIMIAVMVLSSSFISASMNTMLDGTPEQTAQFLQGIDSITSAVGRSYPVAMWAAQALSRPGAGALPALLLYLAVSLGALFLLIAMGTRLFARSAEQTTAPRRSPARAAARPQGVRSPFAAILLREWRLLVRTPAYAVNGLTSVIMGPLLLVSMAMSMTAARSDPGAAQAFAMFSQSSVGVWIVAALNAFIGSINPAVATAVTREGQSFWISKLVPVPYRTQAAAKLSVGMLIAAAGCVIASAGCLLVLSLPLDAVCLGLALSLLFVYPITALGLLVDIGRPNFNWPNETAAIKRSINVFYQMLFGWLGMGILAVPAVLVPGALKFPALFVLMGAACVATFLLFPRAAERRYARLNG